MMGILCQEYCQAFVVCWLRPTEAKYARPVLFIDSLALLKGAKKKRTCKISNIALHLNRPSLSLKLSNLHKTCKKKNE